jgi:hypothetical protein
VVLWDEVFRMHAMPSIPNAICANCTEKAFGKINEQSSTADQTSTTMPVYRIEMSKAT